LPEKIRLPCVSVIEVKDAQSGEVLQFHAKHAYREAEHFEHLVNYNRAKEPEERQHYLNKMLAFNKVRQGFVQRFQ
jgi:hypothetical protein